MSECGALESATDPGSLAAVEVPSAGSETGAVPGPAIDCEGKMEAVLVDEGKSPVV